MVLTVIETHKILLLNVKISKVLLEHGANVNAKDHLGQAAIHHAAKMNHADVVR